MLATYPGERIAGLSKLARAVEAFAAQMQVQEELGRQIAAFLRQHDPRIYPGTFVTCIYNPDRALCAREDDGNGPSLTDCVPLRRRNVALTPGNVLALRRRLAGLDDKLASDAVLKPAGTGSGTIPPSCRRDRDRRGTPPARRPAPATT